MSESFAPGTEVKVRLDWPETRGRVHIRTPHYLRGRAGRVVRFLGKHENPEALAFHRPARMLPLYHVVFAQPEIWQEGRRGDEIMAEIFGSWLERA